ncbi:uncharacterized protein LOC110451480 isoform X2 [Mizuhopecten yessoensis]|uniref:Uncharacterized protein n=1 Tax=Mizuhopecten yessoensis TaxID=6573 RepID=A0A210QLL4_MIZYE|nr:uncharacterized protein LOC110451480 isoform X2 [Mizuhopecten yessoensis]OWF49614.1 hypothetical protein KP79_PYT03540 [Mizuhopecten yessoensis]
MEFALLAMLILGVLQQSMACTYTPARQEVTVFGTRKFYCDYAIGSGNSTVKLSVIPGSRFRTSECSECHCTRNGLQCCGYGVRSSKLVVPNECRVLPDGCEPRLVMKSDNKSECKSTRPPMKPRLEQTISPRVQTGRARQQATDTVDNKWQAMSTVTRQVQGNQATGNQDQGQQVKRIQTQGNRLPGNQASRNRALGNQAPRNQGLGNQAPGNRAPGKQAPGNRVPGNQAPGNRAPGIKAPGNQGLIQQKTSSVQGTAPSPRPAQLAATPAPVKPTPPTQQRRRPASRARPQNRSWRANPFHQTGPVTEESMQFIQNMMLFRALSGGNPGPLQSMMLMNMFEM